MVTALARVQCLIILSCLNHPVVIVITILNHGELVDQGFFLMILEGVKRLLVVVVVIVTTVVAYENR